MGTVRVEDRSGGVRILTLDRPPANAEDETLLTDLSAALDDTRDNMDVRAVVLTGAGKFFSGGFDLSAPRRENEQIVIMTNVFRDAHVKLLTMPKPTITMMNGHAIAGGLILVLACDYRLGLDGDYKIGLNEVAIGAAYPKVAMEIVRLRLTHQRASELLLGAALYPASQAIRLGVVDELFPPEKLEETVMRRAERVGAFPREAYVHTKMALVADTVARVMGEPAEDSARAAAVWMTPESRAARAKQREKLGKKG